MTGRLETITTLAALVLSPGLALAGNAVPALLLGCAAIAVQRAGRRGRRA